MNKESEKSKQISNQMMALEEQLNESGQLLDELTGSNIKKYRLIGNKLQSDFIADAYWNPQAKKAYFYTDRWPNSGEGKSYQLWADVNGEMVSVSVLPQTFVDPIAIPFRGNATSLNITIEKLGGSDHPDVSQLVASIEI